MKLDQTNQFAPVKLNFRRTRDTFERSDIDVCTCKVTIRWLFDFGKTGVSGKRLSCRYLVSTNPSI